MFKVSNMKVFAQPSFTRFGNLDNLKKAFKKAPRQLAGSPEAYEGLVAEFEDPETGRTATCSEINDQFKYKKFLVKMLDGKIITIINDNGKFAVKD
jgi:hypothetical protein